MAPLDFGSLIPGAGGTITINAQTGAATTAGGVIRAGGTVSRAQFIGSGTAGRIVTLSVAPSPTITISNGVNTMTINQLRVSVNGGGPQTFGPNHRLGSTGVINFGIGGRLNVGANQAIGLYSGTFALTMNYQ